MDLPQAGAAASIPVASGSRTVTELARAGVVAADICARGGGAVGPLVAFGLADPAVPTVARRAATIFSAFTGARPLLLRGDLPYVRGTENVEPSGLPIPCHGATAG